MKPECYDWILADLNMDADSFSYLSSSRRASIIDYYTRNKKEDSVCNPNPECQKMI